MNSYLKSGVNIDACSKLIKSLSNFAKNTKRDGAIGEIGSFGSLFDISNIGKKYKEPVLVSSTDGVGTKVLIAQEVNFHNFIGIDLVAMCVNDILAQGAEPLFFLDYFATGSLNEETVLSVVNSIAIGCKEANVALIGGETAEMPGMYQSSKYDLAGFTVGIVEKEKILPKTKEIEEGDLIIGLKSSGIHANGFSLIRKIFSNLKINYNSKSLWEGKTWAELLLTPTRIYVELLLDLLNLSWKNLNFIKGIAHITGGGLIDNIPRILSKGHLAQINLNSWTQPELFSWLANEGKVSKEEMLKVFNCGIGIILIISKEHVNILRSFFQERQEDVFIIGEISIQEKSVPAQVIFS